MFVAEWHSSLAPLAAILKKHYHLLSIDPVKKQIFTVEPTVAFLRPRSLRNQLIQLDIPPVSVTR